MWNTNNEVIGCGIDNNLFCDDRLFWWIGGSLHLVFVDVWSECFW
jgi:hypothetical protein